MPAAGAATVICSKAMATKIKDKKCFMMTRRKTDCWSGILGVEGFIDAKSRAFISLGTRLSNRLRFTNLNMPPVYITVTIVISLHMNQNSSAHYSQTNVANFRTCRCRDFSI